MTADNANERRYLRRGPEFLAFVPWSNCAICGKNRLLLNFKKAQASKEASNPELRHGKLRLI